MFLSALLLAFQAIRLNLMRSFLTLLGVVIGVAAVITMVTLGKNATQAISDQISSLGSNLLVVRPGQRMGPGANVGAPAFKQEDAEAIKAQVTGLQEVVPVVSHAVTLVAGNNNWFTTINGTTNGYLLAANRKLAMGREFLDDEEVFGKAVCLLGETVRKELFAERVPLGEEVRVKGFACQVVGLLAAKGQGAMGIDQDDMVLMPLKTVQRRLTGDLDIPTLLVSTRNYADAQIIMKQIRALLRERRKLTENEVDNFYVMDTRQIAETLSGTVATMTSLLGAVAAVSLLVGGIGIMNIMLVSVTERTKEIGLRLAIGALEKEVLLQFLIEAGVLSAFGGLIGMLLAFCACLGLSMLMHMPFTFDPGINLLSFFVSAAIGIIFGFLPARRAARLDPIEALRHE